MNYIRKHEWLQSVLWTAAFLLAWQLVTTLNLANRYLLPPFSKVCEELYHQAISGNLLDQIANSMKMIIWGFSASVLIGLILVFLCTYSKIINSMIRTLCVIFTPLPGVAILPIIIMVFGIQETSMVVLMVHSVLWPLVINVLGGIKAIPRQYKEFGKNLELNPLKTVTSIHVFSIMPSIVSGLRIGWGRAWRALISAEMVFGMIGTLGGIGYFIYTNRAYGNMTRVMVGVLVVIILGVFFDVAVFNTIEKLTIRKWGMQNE